MTINGFFIENYGVIFELVGILLLLFVSAHISKEMKVKTLFAVFLLFTETLVFYLERWTQTFETLSLLRPILTATLYSVYPAVIIVLLHIIGTRKKKRFSFLLMIPFFLCVPIFYSSQWTHLVFWFQESNNYAGGPLSRLPYILFGFYAAIFIIHNAFYLKNYSRKNRAIVFYIVIGPFVGMVYYLVFNTGKDYNSLFTSAVLLYYMFVYIHMARIDSLTSLLNRQSYYQDIKSNAKSITGVVSVDMNDLKYYNDNMGHEAGDVALRTVSGIMRDNCGANGTVYRVGGDEFMILYKGAKEEDIVNAIAVMRSKMAETAYTCAFGYAIKTPDGNVFETIKESDEKMYIDKAEIKKGGSPNALRSGDKNATGYESITLTVSGMRGTSEYVVENNGQTSSVSFYQMYYANGNEEKRLEKTAETDTLIVNEKIAEYELIKWNGFHGEHPKNVSDGEIFRFNAVINGRNVSADGSANFPAHYNDFLRWLYEILWD